MKGSILASLVNCGVVLDSSISLLRDIHTGRCVVDQDYTDRIGRMATRLVDTVRPRITLEDRGGVAVMGSPFLVMSNHQSLYDIAVLFHVVGPHVRMITKKELRSVPFWGEAMERSRFPFIDRGNRSSAYQTLAEARKLFALGLSVWISPEGTRSRDGSLGPFKAGGFHLALESGIPILPVSIDGTRHILPAKTFASRLDVPVRVTVHAPVDPKSFGQNTSATRKALAEHVRTVIGSALPSVG